MLSQLICIVFILMIFGSFRLLEGHDEETWVEPNAWNRNAENYKLMNNIDASSCPNGDLATTEDNVALIYYKKFIRNMFNRDKMMYEENAGLYQRSILFSILPEQMEKLEQLNDPRDLDIVLSEIIDSARMINTFGEYPEKGIKALLIDIIADILQLLKISEVRFILIVMSTVLFGWFLHHRYHIGIINMILTGLFLFGYFWTYFECNEKLKIKEILEFVDDVNDNDSWYSSLFGIFKTKKDAQINSIKKSSEINLPYCRPDHVLLLYFNDMFLKQFEFLIEKFTNTISSFSTNLPFPYNWCAPLILLFLITYVLKLTYKYILSPKAWASLLHRNSHQQPISGSTGVGTTEDRISGENLKILLNAMKTPHVVFTSGNGVLPAVSGVQEVVEQVDASNNVSSSPNTSQKKELDHEDFDESKDTLKKMP